jgi:hypothetical protein
MLALLMRAPKRRSGRRAAVIAVLALAALACERKRFATEGDSIPLTPVPPSSPSQAPRVVALSPDSGTGASASLEAVFADPDGHQDLMLAQALINGGYGVPGGCCIHWERTGNAFYLVNDDGDGLVGPARPGAAQRLENSRCVLDAERSTVVGDGEELRLGLALELKPALRGTQGVFVRAGDASGVISPFERLGTWTVP